MMLIAHPSGRYRFLKGIAPYSCGVVAEEGYQIVHVTLREATPWRAGFDRIEAHLKASNLDRDALCGVELRSPEPFSMQGFIDFNRDYCARLEAWGLYVDGVNPIARTNVSPVHGPPPAPAVHGFSYLEPGKGATAATLVIAGAGELVDGALQEDRIIRSGDTSPAAIAQKADYVMQVMAERLRGLGGNWEQINTVDVYTVHPLDTLVDRLAAWSPVARHGFVHHVTRPPVKDIEFEMDMRSVDKELVV